MEYIAHVRNAFQEKFGIPRQSGLAPSVRSEIVFTEPYRNPDALRGLEGFSYLWLIWEFSAAKRESWSPTVRPPRLGGNERVGVFASRSPFRPNPIGLSCVRLEEIRREEMVLVVSGADLMDGTPIFDIKPYLPYADAHPEALGGFAQHAPASGLKVECPQELLSFLPSALRQGLLESLAQDPRPSYQDDPERVYGMAFGGFDIGFTVKGGCLTVCRIEKRKPERTSN